MTEWFIGLDIEYIFSYDFS